MSYALGQTDYVRSSRSAMGQLAYTARRPLGQAVTTTTPSEPMSDGMKITFGLGALVVLGGIGYLAYRYPMPSFGMGGGWGGGPYIGVGPGGGRGGIPLAFNSGGKPKPRSGRVSESRKYPRSDWAYEVRNGDTRLGYAEWLEHKRESDRDDRKRK